MFRTLDELVEAACKIGPARIAVAAGHDPDVIEALKQAQDIRLAEAVFFGRAEKIRALAKDAGLDISDGQIHDEPDEATSARRAIALVREGKADLLMKGKINTAVLARAILDKEAGLRTGRLLSQVIVFQVPGFKPIGSLARHLPVSTLTQDEAEALRLADLEGLYHEAAAERMGVSRPSFGCVLERARRTGVQALLEGRVLLFAAGPVTKVQAVEVPCPLHGWGRRQGRGCRCLRGEEAHLGQARWGEEGRDAKKGGNDV